MASTYPGTLDTFTTKVDNVDDYAADDMNEVQNAIIAMQTEAGVDPAGDQTDLTTRLAKIVADSGALKNGTSFPVTTEKGLLFFKSDEDKVYIRNNADDAWLVVGTGFDYVNGTTYNEASADTERSTTNASLTKLKEFSPLARDGSVTIAWEQKGNNASEEFAQVHIDDVAQGSEQAQSSSSYLASSQSNIAVLAGEVISIYARIGSAGTVFVRNAKIQCTNPTTPQEVSGF